MPGFITGRPDGVILSIKLQPKAAANEIGDVVGDHLKIKVKAPPVDGAANEALIRLLAEKLGCAKSHVQIVRGHTSRHKTVKIVELSDEIVLARLK